MSTGYLSSISWWSKWIAEGMPETDNDVSFRKHVDMNSCVIDSPNGSLTLTIPIRKWVGKSCKLKDVRISEHGDWRHKHWHALESTYYNSPFFEYYQDDFRNIYLAKQEFLVDFNAEMLSKVVDLLDLRNVRVSCRPELRLAEYYQVFAFKHGFISDLSIIDLLFNMGPESLIIFNNQV